MEVDTGSQGWTFVASEREFRPLPQEHLSITDYNVRHNCCAFLDVPGTCIPWYDGLIGMQTGTGQQRTSEPYNVEVQQHTCMYHCVTGVHVYHMYIAICKWSLYLLWSSRI